MLRIVTLAVLFAIVVGVALGCGTKDSEVSAGGDPPARKAEDTPLNKDDISAAEKELAELEKSFAVEEKKLAEMKTKIEELCARISAAKGGDEPAKDEIVELLNTLPREKWPEDADDTLRFTQANKWYAENLTGKRASFVVTEPDVRFEGEPDGKVTVHFLNTVGFNEHPAKLFGFKLLLQIQLRFLLSEKSAERVRAWRKGAPMKVHFEIGLVRIGSDKDILASVNAEDVTIEGVEP
jgi:hypothetical protein